ncbi:MAG TPA: HD domain-containing protein [Anaerolineae bacterium]|nr:HD domain-containing protein [Anaerolineae bacterium]
MDTTAVIQMLLHGNQLKRTVRTGWVYSGVPSPENVAAHSYGVCYSLLVLAQLIDEEIDLGHALALAVIHDLPEGVTSDIPSPAWRMIPGTVKGDLEEVVMDKIVAGQAWAEPLRALWAEMNADETAEAHLVHDADKIDMFLQAYKYERQTGNRDIARFWDKYHTFHYEQSQAIYDTLRQWREAEGL